MKAHVLTQGQCRAGARRVCAGHRATGVTQRRSRSARHGVAVSTARTYAPPVRTATGFLIPRLSSTVPLAYEGQVPGSLGHIQALVKHGALTLTSEGATAEDLIEQGICALVHPGILKYEDQWGERLSVTLDQDGIGFSVGSDPHGWKMRLKPIVTRLTSAEAAAFVCVLNQSLVQGPFNWGSMDAFFGGEMLDHSEETAREASDDTTASLALEAHGNVSAEESSAWLAHLFLDYPVLKAVAPDGEQLTMKHIVKRPRDDGLRALIAAFVAANAAVSSAGLTGDTALMVTSWDKHCPINHAHDFHCQQLHNGDWDWPDGTPPFCTHANNINDLATKLNLVGEFIAAAQALEEWTNAHC